MPHTYSSGLNESEERGERWTRRMARIIKPDAAGIQVAARSLAEGALVAFPTETVYGLGADAGNAEAVARLYAAKGRPSFNPLIAHVADLDSARELARLDEVAEQLAAAFWPGRSEEHTS